MMTAQAAAELIVGSTHDGPSDTVIRVWASELADRRGEDDWRRRTMVVHALERAESSHDSTLFRQLIDAALVLERVGPDA